MEQEPAASSQWSWAKKLAFRFVFSYLVLYNLPFPLTALYGTEPLGAPYDNLWKAVVPWVGRLLRLRREITVFPNGSGDTTFNYVQLLCFLVLALAVAAVWTALDTRRSDYARLHSWLRIYLRFSLGVTLLSYGAAKLLKSQFPAPFLMTLVHPIGDSSPMGLLWTFMGVSYAYNVFTGAGEAAAGLLLFARRTTTAGALLAVAVLSHVVVLNFCYDVPVKIFSLHLLAMAAFLLLPDLRPLADFLLRGRPATPVPGGEPFESPRWNRAAGRLRTVFVALAVVSTFAGAWKATHEWGDLVPKPPLHGLYDVVEFSRDGQLRPPLVGDRSRWKQLIIDRPQFLTLVLMDEGVRYFDWKADLDRKTFTLLSRDAKPVESLLRYQEQGNDLLFEGSLAGEPVRARLRRRDPGTFLLLNRGFHWVNEYPFNR